MANKESTLGDFLDKYLAYVEKKDARDGATKWVLLAAAAALGWQGLSLYGQVSLPAVFAPLALLLTLYFVADRLPELLRVDSTTHEEARFFSRRPTRPADARYILALFCRYALTIALLFLAYGGRENLRDPSYKIAFAMVLAPIVLVAGAYVALLWVIRKEYQVRKKFEPGLWGRISIFTVLVVIPLAGLLCLDALGHGSIFRVKYTDVKVIQLSILVVGLLFLHEKYVRMLRVDGQAAAVRSVWMKFGLQEISEDDAMREMQLLVAGASLNEVIGSDVKSFLALADEVSKLGSLARKEFESVPDNLEEPSLVRGAIENSVSNRLAQAEAAFERLTQVRDELVEKCRKMMLGQRDAEMQALKRDLDEKVENTRLNLAQVKLDVQASRQRRWSGDQTNK